MPQKGIESSILLPSANRGIMNYEDTKTGMLLAYPRLFIDEVDVLHQLFFVNGNGMEWKNGELTDGKTSIQQYIDEANMHRGDLDKTNPDYMPMGATIEELHSKEEKYRLRMIEDYGEECDCWYLLSDGRIGRIMYPICQYAKILHVPKDVKQDWLKAANKAIELTRTDIFRLTESDKEWIQKADLRIKYMRLL